MMFSHLLIFIVAAIVLGVLYNKLVVRHFGGWTSKICGFLTILIFICTAMPLSVGVSVNRFTNSMVRSSAEMVAQYIYRTFPNNELIANGICLNGIDDNILQVSSSVSELRAVVQPNYLINVGITNIAEENNSTFGIRAAVVSRVSRNIGNWVNEVVANSPIGDFFNQIEDTYQDVQQNIRVAYYLILLVGNFANNYNVLTVSSVLAQFAFLITREIDLWFLLIIYIPLLTPLIIYVFITSIVAIVVVWRRRKKQSGIVSPPPISNVNHT